MSQKIQLQTQTKQSSPSIKVRDGSAWSQQMSDVQHSTLSFQMKETRKSTPVSTVEGMNTNVRRHYATRGFSFAEVMFAVVILGIGFIMVAAIFPVAIQQTQATGEENMASTAARDAADSIISMPSSIANPAYVPGYTAAQATANPAVTVQSYPTYPPTVKNYVQGTSFGAVAPPAIVVPFTGTRWQLLQGNSIVACDKRFAYVPFYKRENGSAAAELIVLAVASRNKPVYVPLNDAQNSTITASGTTTQLASYPSPTMQTQICPDTITVGSPYSEGGCVFNNATAIPQSYTTPLPTGRTYTFGRGVGSPIGADPAARTFNQFDINPGDNMALTAGADGNWGTKGAIYDAPLANATCAANTSTTLQPVTAYATLTETPNNPLGQITLYADSISTVSPQAAGPGAFVIVADDYPFDPANQDTAGPYSLVPNNLTSNPPFQVGALNGRIFRLSSLVGPGTINGGTIYNLDPSFAMRPVPLGGRESPDMVPSQALIDAAGIAAPNFKLNFRVKVYIVGVGLQSSSGTSSYTGSTQDIGIFATYFPVK